jgi:hypothetical protein
MRVKIETALQHIEQRIEQEALPRTPFVGLVLRTRPKMLKANRVTGEANPYQGVVRLAYRLGQIGSSFENAVTNRAFKLGVQDETTPVEEYFQAGPLWNGKGRWITKFCVEHIETREQYLAFKPRQDDTEAGYKIHIVRDEWYDLAGNVLNIEDIRDYLPLETLPKNQPVEPKEAVGWRTVKLENIVQINCRICYDIIRGDLP